MAIHLGQDFPLATFSHLVNRIKYATMYVFIIRFNINMNLYTVMLSKLAKTQLYIGIYLHTYMYVHMLGPFLYNHQSNLNLILMNLIECLEDGFPSAYRLSCVSSVFTLHVIIMNDQISLSQVVNFEYYSPCSE